MADPVTLIAAGVNLGLFVYHRWIEDGPKPTRTFEEVRIPLTERGAPVPMIFGRGRVRAPILIDRGPPQVQDGGIGNTFPANSNRYGMNLLFRVGLPMGDGDGTTQLHGVYQGEERFTGSSGATIIAHTALINAFGNEGQLGGLLRWFDGNSSQDAAVLISTHMGSVLDSTPGHRGYVTVMLYDDTFAWTFGSSPNVPSYSIDISSRLQGGGFPDGGTLPSSFGSDINPMDAVYDLLTGKRGKLRLPTSLIDTDSLRACAITLAQENHGLSRIIEDKRPASEILHEIFQHVDGVMYEEPRTGKLVAKLIRNDYDQTTIPHLTKHNTARIENLAIGGWTGLPNKIRVVYENADDDYREDSVTAHNHANAVGQDGEEREQVLEFRWCKKRSLAERYAARELAARSRPLIKCRAICDRSMIRVRPGDAVKLTWQDPDISGLIFRVAAVDHGSLIDNRIALDLIQDYFYVWRNQAPRKPVEIVNPGLPLA